MNFTELDLLKATGTRADTIATTNLNKVFQLTGFSDPIYAEATVTVHQYDILLGKKYQLSCTHIYKFGTSFEVFYFSVDQPLIDVMVINQTGDTLQNVCLELATLGDLKLCERPLNYTIGSHDKKHITANIKVSSTGRIFNSSAFILVYFACGYQSFISGIDGFLNRYGHHLWKHCV